MSILNKPQSILSLLIQVASGLFLPPTRLSGLLSLGYWTATRGANRVSGYGGSFWISVFALLAVGSAHASELRFPKNSDWKEKGVVLKAGSGWDKNLDGMLSPSTVLKKDGVYYLYYVGADGKRSTDGGPRHRALGVATSHDGVHFTKYKNNPVIKYLPHENQEEGIFSATAFVDGSEIVMYYSGLIAPNRTSESVASDIHVAVSSNGLDFVDKGIVLSHKDKSVWGYGDELFPVGTYKANGNWYVYYIAKGNGAKWDLGLARGSNRANIGTTERVIKTGDIKDAEVISLGPNKIGVLLYRSKLNKIEARTASVNSPDSLSNPLEKWGLPKNENSSAAVLFAEERNTWFLYYMGSNKEIRVKMANAGLSGPDPKSPQAPVNVVLAVRKE